MSIRRMIPFLLLNIFVSAATVFGMWTYLERRGSTPALESQSADVSLIIPTQPVVGSANTVQGEVGVISEDPNAAGLVDPNAGGEPTAETAAQPTPTPELVQNEPTYHVVQSGDLLGNIADSYGVTVDEIVEANGLANPNQIFVGQELLIPIGGVTSVEDSAEQAEPTPVPTVAIGTSTFEIGNVSGVGDLASEQVLVTNIGSEAVDLTGWTLSNDAGSTWTFGEQVLFGGGAGITIYSGAGDSSALEKYWSLSAAAWSSGDVLVLRDANGNIQAERIVP